MIGTPRFQHGSLTLKKNKTAPATWFFRYYEERDGHRLYRNRRIGTVVEFPRRRDAEKAVLHLRANINSEARSPETVGELIAHYQKNELNEESGKRSSTRTTYSSFLSGYVEPHWGRVRLDQVKPIEVERWLRSLDLAPGTKSKIRNIMSALFAHARRYGMILTNPIQAVRSSAKRLREPDILTPEEFNSLVEELPVRERVMVLLAGTTGLRRSELIALTWGDVDFRALQIRVNKSCVWGEIGETKTAASAKPVPLHQNVAEALEGWKAETDYKQEGDFLFPSLRKKGEAPVVPDMILRRVIRPAAERAGIVGKRIGWHTFRHSLGTNLRSLGVDVKVAQTTLRHANSRITMDLYTQAVPSAVREANTRVMDLFLKAGTIATQHRSAPSGTEKIEVAV